MAHFREKLSEELRQNAARFLKKELNSPALVTVTDIRLSKDEGDAVILFTVYPDAKEQEVLVQAQGLNRQFRAVAKQNIRVKYIPRITFAIDAGEKNRQRIDELSRAEEDDS